MSRQTSRTFKDEIAALFVLAVLCVPVLAALAWSRVGGGAPPAGAPVQGGGRQPPAPQPAPLDGADRQYLMALLLDSLDALADSRELPDPSDAPEACREARHLELFATLHAPGRQRARASAREASLALSTLSVAGQLYDQGGFFAESLPPRSESRVRFDILTRQHHLPHAQRGVFSLTAMGAPLGIALRDGATRHVFLPGDLAESWALDNLTAFRAINREAGLPPRDWRDRRYPVQALGAESFVNDAPGSTRCVGAVRGLPVVERVGLAEARASRDLAALQLARLFGLSTVRDPEALAPQHAETFAAAYDALTGLPARGGELRAQAQAAAALARFPGRRGEGADESILTALRMSLLWLNDFVRVPDDYPDTAVVLRSEAADRCMPVQDTAAVLTAFCEYRHATADGTWDDLIERLGAFLLLMQDDEGAFRMGAGPQHAGDGDAAQAEAALALALAYREVPDRVRFLLGSQRALSRLAERSESSADPEASRRFIAAVRGYSVILPPNRFMPRLREAVSTLMAAQLSPRDAPAPDLAGGALHGYPPPVGETAADLEAFVGAWLVLAASKDPRAQELCKQARDAALDAARYVAQFQYSPLNSYYLRDPQPALGGVRRQPGSNLVTLEATHRALDGMGLLAQALAVEQKESR